MSAKKTISTAAASGFNSRNSVRDGSYCTGHSSGELIVDSGNRHEVAILDSRGKYEPHLKMGIPAEVLARLLPDAEDIEIKEPCIAGGIRYCIIKRTFDIVSCCCALLVFAIPMIVIAIIIRSESKCSAIYTQQRMGKNGHIFNVYKFRSMYADAESRGAQWAQGDDPRVMPFGRFLRHTRMDEIPQFWNVLKGDMSLIGPRPERPAFCKEFEKRIHGWHYRTCVRPGLSGLAQVTGGYDLLPREKIILDMEYIEHRSIALDAKIIKKTLKVIATGEGAR